jgi:hypothetical protein
MKLSNLLNTSQKGFRSLVSLELVHFKVLQKLTSQLPLFQTHLQDYLAVIYMSLQRSYLLQDFQRTNIEHRHNSKYSRIFELNYFHVLFTFSNLLISIFLLFLLLLTKSSIKL